MQIKITSEADLKSAAAVLHDARFTADAINFDATTHSFALKCWVLEPKPESTGVVRGWRAHQLFFGNVSGCKVSVKEKVLYYELAAVRFNQPDSRLDLITHYAIEMSLQIGFLEGALTETNERREQWSKSASTAA